jgi:hypothetical protein
MKWESLCRAAILETDWSKIEERILAADFAIAERLHEFSLNHGGTPEENQALADAVNALRVLKKEATEWKLKTGKPGHLGLCEISSPCR